MTQLTPKAKRTAVLLVEDDPVTAYMMKQVLFKTYMLHHATFGQEALKLIAKYDFDIVLMDIDLYDAKGLAYMSGIDVAAEIREQSRYDHIKIIAVTSNMMADIREEYLRAGFNDYVQKPITPDEILTLVESALHPNEI